MTIENLGGAGGLTDAQLNVIKEKFGEAKAEKLITLFESGEDKGEAGLYDDIEAMGFERADLEALAEADPALMIPQNLLRKTSPRQRLTVM